MPLIFILLVVGLILFLFLRFIKIPKLGDITLITGGVKTGKSMLTVCMAIRELRKRRFRTFIYNHITRPFQNATIVKLSKKFSKDPLPKRKRKEYPLLYSTIPLRVDYVPLTREILEREQRVVYGSVVFVDEASLIADAQMKRDHTLDEPLTLFHKLFGHMSRGGILLINTQSVSDLHFSTKKCINSYLWIHHQTKLPFFSLLYVRELAYQYDQDGSGSNVTNTVDRDAEDDLKLIFVPHSVWNKYDRYCYSLLTDHKDVPRKIRRAKRDGLKSKYIVSFRKFTTFRNVDPDREEFIQEGGAHEQTSS